MKDDENNNPYYEFWAALFHFDIDENHTAYKALSELIADKEFLQSYFHKKDREFKEKLSQDDKARFPEDINANLRAINLLTRMGGIEQARNIFNRQTLVVLATLIESMLDEFFLCVFCKNPEKMYEYIQASDEKIRGKVDIKEILNSRSREELLLSLAKQAASKAMQGEFKSAVKRLQKLTIGDKFSKDLSAKVIALNDARNKIVHELSNVEVSFDDVQKGFETAFELVEYLENIAAQMDIPVMEIDPKDNTES
jgi:hypothetical protein